jgi:hypothetical protein
MRERVAMLDGTLKAERLPDGGYRVAAFLPADGPDPSTGRATSAGHSAPTGHPTAHSTEDDTP